MEAASPSVSPLPTPPAPDQRSVLIVEDNRAINGALVRMLQTRGLRVDTAESLADGVRLVSTLRPDLLILDLMLPDGPGALLLGRSRRESPATRVVVITGMCPNDARDSLGGLQPDAFLAKPFSFQQLLEQIAEPHAHAV